MKRGFVLRSRETHRSIRSRLVTSRLREVVNLARI